MALGFFGRYEHSLDSKGGSSCPARFRAQFDTTAYVTQHLEGCLALWTPAEFEKQIAEMLAEQDRSAEDRNNGAGVGRHLGRGRDRPAGSGRGARAPAGVRRSGPGGAGHGCPRPHRAVEPRRGTCEVKPAETDLHGRLRPPDRPARGLGRYAGMPGATTDNRNVDTPQHRQPQRASGSAHAQPFDRRGGSPLLRPLPLCPIGETSRRHAGRRAADEPGERRLRSSTGDGRPRSWAAWPRSQPAWCSTPPSAAAATPPPSSMPTRT